MVKSLGGGVRYAFRWLWGRGGGGDETVVVAVSTHSLWMDADASAESSQRRDAALVPPPPVGGYEEGTQSIETSSRGNIAIPLLWRLYYICDSVVGCCLKISFLQVMQAGFTRGGDICG